MAMRRRRHALVASVLIAALFLLLRPTKLKRTAFSATGRSWWAKLQFFHGRLASSCTPRHTVFFLKTHKCASSTVQNLLVRYGERHGLTFALPPSGVYLGHPDFLNRTMAQGTPPFDMLVHHTRFQEVEARALLKPDPVFVTIVREPASLFESLYSFNDLEKTYNVRLEELQNATKNASLVKKIFRTLPGRSGGSLGLNQMSYDLGFDIEQSQNDSAVRHFIERVDAVFDLVMVAERMNESLVLLRHLLCWNLNDVIVFKLNARQSDFRRSLSAELTAELRALNSVDTLLYEYFTQRFERHIEAFGRLRMKKEVYLLERRMSFWYQRCVGETISTNNTKISYTRHHVSAEPLACWTEKITQQ
ncbi:galactosylceramide sulfotransferase-like isoform X2 [Dermacentor albipictus]|uniref:galactosylceramide sulfotransferase-like isoform X2 n=1 Tax=Dermacentor albipictus TaxID=60249 RepID=UPI0038FCA831